MSDWDKLFNDIAYFIALCALLLGVAAHWRITDIKRKLTRRY